MASVEHLALTPPGLTIDLYTGATSSITFLWPEGSLVDRTFSARIVTRDADVVPTVTVEGDAVVVDILGEDVAALAAGVSRFELRETTTGRAEPRIVAHVRATVSPATPTTSTIQVIEGQGASTVQVTVLPVNLVEIGAASAAALEEEIARATGIEETLQEDLDAETQRATGVELSMADALDAEIADRTAGDEDLAEAIALRIALAAMGAANGVATLDSGGKIPDAQIPAEITRDTELTAAVAAAVNALLDGAPGALNTLNEIAAAINDDANFAAAVTAALAARAMAGDAASAGAAATSALLKSWTSGECYELLAITRDANEVVTSATVKWPDGSTGTFTTVTKNVSPPAINAYTISHALSGKVVTQALMTRDAAGAVTVKPALTVA